MKIFQRHMISMFIQKNEVYTFCVKYEGYMF